MNAPYEETNNDTPIKRVINNLNKLSSILLFKKYWMI